MGNLSFRKAYTSDLQEMQQLFVATITNVCDKDYNAEQIRAWISGVNDTQRWLDRFEEQLILLAVVDDQITGFGTIKDGNYIDMLFVHKDFQGKGVAGKIYQGLEGKAKELKSDHITSDVSITAKPFFEKMGFIVVKEHQVERLGIELVNYRMRKEVGI